MKILILSRKPNLFFNQKVERIGKSTDIEVNIIDPFNCELILDGERSKIYYNGKLLEKPDYVIPRMSVNVLDFGLSVLRHFELMGVPVLNSSLSLKNMLNRFDYLQIVAAKQKIKTTKSVLLRKSSQIKTALSFVGGPPAILKIISGNDKLGTMLVDNVSTIESLFDVNFIMSGMGQIGQNIILEEYVRESNGKSTHLLLLNKEIMAAYSKIKSFNPKQAAAFAGKSSLDLVIPTKTMMDIAVMAADILDVEFASFGFLESIDGPKLFEINVNPDIEIFEKDNEIQVVPRLLSHIVSVVRSSTSVSVE